MAQTKKLISTTVSSMRAGLRADRARITKQEKALDTFKDPIRAALARLEKVAKVGGGLFTVSSVDCSADYDGNMEMRVYAYITDVNDILQDSKRVRGALMLAGYDIGETTTRASEWSSTASFTAARKGLGFSERVDVSMYLTDSGKCHKVQTGVKEVPVYEIKCD